MNRGIEAMFVLALMNAILVRRAEGTKKLVINGSSYFTAQSESFIDLLLFV